MKSDENSFLKNLRLTDILGLAIAFILVLAAILTVGLLLPRIISGGQTFYEAAGQFGDMFGVMNAMATTLALVAVGYTAILQSRQLSDARKQMAASDHARKRQEFETSLFHLLDLRNSLITTTRVGEEHGRNALRWIAHNVDFGLELLDRVRLIKNPDSLRADFESAYRKRYDQQESQLGHYFRVFYRILRLIEDGAPKDPGDLYYVKILRSQLASYELKLLFGNCLIEEGEKLKRFVEKYALLKHVDREQIGNVEGMSLYKPSAFHDADEKK